MTETFLVPVAMPGKTPLKIGFVILLSLLAVVYLLVDWIPPRSLTSNRMKGTMQSVLKYAREHDKLPETLAALPANDRFRHVNEDAWDRPFVYSFDGAGVVTFLSLGADGRPGGEGDDRDMVGSFNARDPQGRWLEEILQWKDHPLVK